jgi:hypothetical protein
MSSLLIIAVGASVVAAIAATTRQAPDTAELAPVKPLTDIGTDTVLPVREADGWQVKTLNSLSAVEAFLDQLEYCRITERELVILSNDSFAVRWRAA